MRYVIKGKLTGLTPAEKVFLATHPHLVLTIKEDADKASSEAQRRFRGPGLHNGNGDAFRHCYWSALLARDIGKQNARGFTTAHEAYSENPGGERAMDLHNNGAGILIGGLYPKATDIFLASKCNAALASGTLMTTPPLSGSSY